MDHRIFQLLVFACQFLTALVGVYIIYSGFSTNTLWLGSTGIMLTFTGSFYLLKNTKRKDQLTKIIVELIGTHGELSAGQLYAKIAEERKLEPVWGLISLSLAITTRSWDIGKKAAQRAGLPSIYRTLEELEYVGIVKHRFTTAENGRSIKMFTLTAYS